MRRLFGCPDFVSLTNKIINGQNFFPQIFTENKPVRGLRKKYNIPDMNWLSIQLMVFLSQNIDFYLLKP